MKPRGWAVNCDCKTGVAGGNSRLSVGLGVGGPWSVDKHLKKPVEVSNLRDLYFGTRGPKHLQNYVEVQLPR